MALSDNIFVELVEQTIIADIVQETLLIELIEVTSIQVDIVQETIQVNIADSEVIQADIIEEVILVEVENWAGCTCTPGTTTNVAGQIFVIGVTSTGIVTDYAYATSTVPPNKVVLSCLTDNDIVSIQFMAEGGEYYSPTVTVDGIVCTNLTQYTNDQRLFYGSVDVTITDTRTITLESSTGISCTVIINRASAGPEILSCLISDYPATQTEAKENDTVHIIGTVESSATHIKLLAYGAFKETSWILVSGGTYNISGMVSLSSGSLKAKVVAKNLIGTEGTEFLSGNSITLNQTVPVFSDLAIIYPFGQTAFKDFETGTKRTIVSNYTSLTYSSPNGNFVVSNSLVYEEVKTITCTNPGTYNDSVTNFRIVALKSSNGTSATFNKTIEVADVAPVVTVTQPQSRLRSAPLGQLYTITCTSNQNLSSNPDITIPVGGTWQGSNFTGGPKVFTRSILISDSDGKGTGVWNFVTVPTNRAGVQATISGNQVNGGFIARDLVLDAFQNEISVNVMIMTYTKLKISMWEFTGESLLRSSTINDTPPVPDYFTVNAIEVTPHIFRILDTNQTLASSKATVVYNYEEEV